MGKAYSPEQRAFWAASNEWEHKGHPQSGPVYDRLNETRAALIAARQQEKAEEVKKRMGPQGPGPVGP